jgi:amylosucrase
MLDGDWSSDVCSSDLCEIAYNATFMALLWDAVATKNAALLTQGVQSLPHKLERATWLNYVRCHDDIGLGFDDNDIRLAGYDPASHRRFLIDYYTGRFEGSPARGLPFGENPKTGDARISGALASLVGLETALEAGDPQAIDAAVRTIVLLHAMILSFGGIPLFYYGDAIGTLNSLEYLADPDKAVDNRWLHRSRFDWNKAARRHQSGSIEQRIFTALKRLIAVRKETTAFADFDNRFLLYLANRHLLGYVRSDAGNRVLVLANFHTDEQSLPLAQLLAQGFFRNGCARDLCSGERIFAQNEALTLPPLTCYWLAGCG